MEERILKILGDPNYSPLNISQLVRRLKLTPNDKPDLQRLLGRLEREGRIARIKGNRYILPVEADLIPGRIRINRQGKGFLEADDPKLPTITVAEHDTGTAFNGDRVLVRRDVRYRGRSKTFQHEETGKVIRILERERTQLVGTLQRSNRFLYVIPDDPRIPHDIYVPEARDVGRRPNLGDKVVVELKAWESRHVNPEGEIIEVLGAPDEEGVDMLSVLRQYNMPLHFPKTVLDEARAIGNQIDERDMEGREDCRSHTVVTIDPVDAKDFDDAICLQAAPNGQWKLWVHIADVSHYVKVGSALDEEAVKRGNSTYLVDRVIPMLPEALSNELCSLKPNVDRLTKCVEFLLSAEGKVLKSRCYPAVIHSKRRFTYEEVMAILQRKPTGEIEEMLHHSNTMAQRLRHARMKAGSLDLDFPETKIRLDEQGRILRIERVENDVSHQLIEEYMLLANEAVAGKLMALERETVYRIHEPPDEKRLQEFREDVLSHQIQCGNLTNRHEIQKLLNKLNSIPIGPALKIAFLKSLMRARYAIEPLGHYGLAKTKYTHFTSPIRRYADLVVHRSLFQKPKERAASHPLRNVAERISDTERNSADAERDSKDVKLFAFLQSQLDSGRPQRYSGLVTDVRNFGFFVDVSGLGMSGVVPLSTLTDDFYQYDTNRNQLVGRRTRRVFKLGDRVEVQIFKVDKFKKQVDFSLAGPERREMPKREMPRLERPKFEKTTYDRPQFKLSYPTRRSGRRRGGR
jgi:ribonuclease R